MFLNVQPGPAPSPPPAGQSRSLGEGRDGEEKEVQEKAASTPSPLADQAQLISVPFPPRATRTVPFRRASPKPRKGVPGAAKLGHSGQKVSRRKEDELQGIKANSAT